jgi:2-keto-3-deoxy-6-phosphogluconate aldolase
VGGVTPANLAEYFAAGARAVGVSTSLFGKEALRNRDIGQVGAQVKKFIEQCPPKG